MAEAKRARTAAAPLQITITYSNGNWKCNPPNPKAGARVDNGGQVNFHCSQHSGCRVYTDPLDAFANEVNGYEQLTQIELHPVQDQSHWGLLDSGWHAAHGR